MAKKKEDSAFVGPACPACGEATLPGTHYCYKCGSFLDASGTRARECGEVQDEEIEALLAAGDRLMQESSSDPRMVRMKQLFFLSIIGVIAGSVMIFTDLWAVGIPLFLICVVIIALLGGKLVKLQPPEYVDEKHYRIIVGKYVIPTVLGRIFDRLDRYGQEEHFPYEIIGESKLITQNYNRQGGNNYISGIYHGVPVQMSNITMEDVDTEDGETKNITTVFEGTWYLCDLGLHLPASVNVREKEFSILHRGNIKTGDEAFDHQFFTTCSDADTAGRFLTPVMMEAIRKIGEVCGGKTYLYAMTDGRICFAVDRRKQYMDIRRNGESLADLRVRIEDEVRMALAAVDLLKEACGTLYL